MDSDAAQTAARPTVNIVGEKVALGPLRKDLVPLMARWINDLDVTRTLGRWDPATSEQEQDWYDSAIKDKNAVHFTVYERETMRPIGTTSLFDINRRHGTAEFGILIGEKDAWGKGFGTETTRLLLDYAFNSQNLHNVHLRAMAYNARGLRAYEKAGFKLMGREREAYRIAGKAHDVVWMDCLSTEFESPVLARMFDGGGQA